MLNIVWNDGMLALYLHTQLTVLHIGESSFAGFIIRDCVEVLYSYTVALFTFPIAT